MIGRLAQIHKHTCSSDRLCTTPQKEKVCLISLLYFKYKTTPINVSQSGDAEASSDCLSANQVGHARPHISEESRPQTSEESASSNCAGVVILPVQVEHPVVASTLVSSITVLHREF